MTNLNDLLDKLRKYTGEPISDPRLIWLLIGVDHRYIEKDGIEAILKYESREYGCIGAMGKAFIKLLTDVSSDDLFNIEDAKTPELQEICAAKIESRMIDFHRLCVDKVSDLNTGTKPGEYRQSPMSYGFLLDSLDYPNGTAMGYTYLNLRRAIRGPKVNGVTQFIENFYAIANRIDGSFKVICFAKPDDIKNLARSLIIRLIQDLQIPYIVDAEALLYICEFIQDMTLLHPFTDANNRVLVNLLLNEILIDTGFYPVIFREPNIFDGFHPQELKLEIDKGQQLLRQALYQFGVFSTGIQENSNALLRLALRSDSPELIDMSLSNTGVPDFFREKFISIVLDFKEQNISNEPIDLLQDENFLRYFLRSYEPDVVFASTGILLSLLNDNTSGHLSWHLDFFIKYFFDNNYEEHVIIDGYFNALTLIHEGCQDDKSKTLLDTLFSPSGNGNTLYKYSKNRTSIIFRCINWYTRIKGLNAETEKSINGLPELLDKQSPVNTKEDRKLLYEDRKLSYEERRRIDNRIENVFRQGRNRTLSA